MQISAKRSKINFRSFLWHAVFLALASNFMDVDTIIPSMLIKAGGNSVHLGFLTAIMLGGSGVFQLIFAPILSKNSLKLKYLLLGINLRIVALLLMSAMFFFSHSLRGDTIILLIFILISIFSFSGSYSNVSYIDILGKSVKEESRKHFFSIKEIIASIGIFLSAIVVRDLIKRFEYPDNYSFLFLIAGVLLLIASLGFWNLREVRSINPVKRNIIDFFKLIPNEIRRNKNLKYYLLIINTLGLGIGFLPFLILFAKENFDLSYELIGNFLLFRIIGMLFASIIFYKFSTKIDYKVLLIVAIIIGSIIPVLALTLSDNQFYYQLIFILSGIFVSLFKISNNGILLEISTNENRTIYAGISGAGKIFSTVFPLLAGLLIFYIGFTAVFIIVSVIILLSYFFVKRLDCKTKLIKHNG
ncbi:MAG: MFS transporter [Bacteroidales bacterium]|nr:MFS transporter [Bacteroidales bacterium]